MLPKLATTVCFFACLASVCAAPRTFTPSYKNEAAPSLKLTARTPVLRPSRQRVNLQPPVLPSALNEQELAHLRTTDLTVEFDSGQTFALSWDVILNALGAPLLDQLWRFANVTESLGITLLHRTALYHPTNAVTSIGNGSGGACPVRPGENSYNVSAFPSVFPGYMGEFGVPSNTVRREYLHYIMDVFGSQLQPLAFLYPLRAYAVYVALSFLNGNLQVAGVITGGFMSLVLVRSTQDTPPNRPYTMALLFGEKSKLPIAQGALQMSDITVASNDRHSMVLLATQQTMEHILQYLQPDYESMFARVTNQSLLDIIGDVENDVLRLQASGVCGRAALDNRFLSLLFSTLAAHFLAIEGLSEIPYSEMKCLAEHDSRLATLRALLAACYPSMYTKGFQSSTLVKIAATQILQAPMEYLRTADAETRATVLTMGQIAANFEPAVNRTLWGVAETVWAVYDGFVDNFVLSTNDRALLLEAHMSTLLLESRHRVVRTRNLGLTYLLATSMCSTLEIATLVDVMRNPTTVALNTTFSPCYMSLRFDFSEEKLFNSAFQKPDATVKDTRTAAQTLFNVLHQEHMTTVNLLPAVACVKDNSTLVVAVPLPQITYFVSRVPIPGALVYRVSEVFLNNDMYISAFGPDCKPPLGMTATPRDIEVVYNVSSPRRECIFCGSVLFAYDEKDGFLSMMYVTTHRVQNHLFLGSSPFFDTTNLHTHYLMMMSNGTVIEIRGRYRERVTGAFIIILFLIGVLTGGYFVYKMITYCC